MKDAIDETLTFSLDDVRTKSFLNSFNDDLLGHSDGRGFGYANPRLLKQAFYSQEWVYILVDKYGQYLAQLPWQVHKEKVVEGEMILEPALGHPLQRSLDFPNPLQSAFHFKYSVIVDLMTTGNSFIFDSKSNGWLVQFPAEITEMRIDGAGNLSSYDIIGFDPMSFPVGSKESLDPRKVIHIKRPNPSSVYWGLSPLIAGSNSLMFQTYATEYLINYFKKGAQPGIVLQFDEESNVEQAKRLLQSLESSNSGRQNQRRGMILPKGVSMVPMQTTLADSQLLEYLDDNRERIINIYGVPKQELSIAESSSLGSDEYRTAIANFWRGPLTSTAMLIESALTQHFQSRLGRGYVIKLNMAAVPALQDDLKSKAETATAMRSTMTLNEVRQRVWKLGPVPGGDVVQLPSGPQAAPQFGGFGGGMPSAAVPIASEVPAITAPTEDRTIETQTPDIKPLSYREQNISAIDQYRKSDDGKWLDDYQSRQDDHAKKSEGPVAKLFLNMLDRQLTEAVRITKKHLEKHKASEVPAAGKLREDLEDAFEKNKRKWTEEYVQTLEAQVDIGYDNVLKIPFNQPYQDEIDSIRARGEKGRRAILRARGIETFQNVNATTTERIMNAIETGMGSAQTLQQIAKTITDISNVSAGRAFTIARTETLTAASAGQAAAMEDAQTVIPNMVKVWINAQDDRVRGNPNGLYPDAKDDHWKMQSEVVDVDQQFSNGLRYPRDTKGEAAQVINCRCTWLAVSEDDLPRLGITR